MDPPFNTGKVQARRTLAAVRDSRGRAHGVPGSPLHARGCSSQSSYRDSFDDYLAFLTPRLEHAHRLLAREGTLYFHIDYREAHYCKLLLDEVFGRECFLNEIIWAYDYGARTGAAGRPSTTRSSSTSRTRPRILRRGGGRPRAVHGARAW